jgi:hypothetical protein
VIAVVDTVYLLGAIEIEMPNATHETAEKHYLLPECNLRAKHGNLAVGAIALPAQGSRKRIACMALAKKTAPWERK